MRMLVALLLALSPVVAHEPENVASSALLRVEFGTVSIDFAIRSQDSAAFRNLLSDELYRALDLPPEPHAERLKRFSRDDFVVKAGEEVVMGVPGPFRVESRPEGAVVLVTVRYASPTMPASIAVRPPPIGAIRLASFHRGVPVHESRALKEEVVLDLDRDDPRRSRLRGDAGITRVYLHLQPLRIRQEIALRRRDIEHGDVNSILGKRMQLMVNANQLIAEPESVEEEDGIIKVVRSYSLTEPATALAMTWNELAHPVPVHVSDGKTFVLTRDAPMGIWQRSVDTAWQARPLPEPPGDGLGWSIAFGGVFAVGLFLAVFGRPRAGIVTAVVGLGLWFGVPYGPRVSTTEGEAIVEALLNNAYGSQMRDDLEEGFDMLVASTARAAFDDVGALTRNATWMDNVRLDLQRVDLHSCGIEFIPSRRHIVARCTWTVVANYRHWGHTHPIERTVDAVVLVQPVGKTWRIGAIRPVG